MWQEAKIFAALFFRSTVIYISVRSCIWSHISSNDRGLQCSLALCCKKIMFSTSVMKYRKAIIACRAGLWVFLPIVNISIIRFIRSMVYMMTIMLNNENEGFHHALWGAKDKWLQFRSTQSVLQPCPIDSVCTNNKYGNTSDPNSSWNQETFFQDCEHGKWKWLHFPPKLLLICHSRGYATSRVIQVSSYRGTEVQKRQTYIMHKTFFTIEVKKKKRKGKRNHQNKHLQHESITLKKKETKKSTGWGADIT